jgi:hypothetical protein
MIYHGHITIFRRDTPLRVKALYLRLTIRFPAVAFIHLKRNNFYLAAAVNLSLGECTDKLLVGSWVWVQEIK